MYLILKDLKRLIQSENLQQVIGSDTDVLTSSLLAAQSEATSYLVQKYITDREFSDTNSYDPDKVYYANSRVYLDAPIYNATITYLFGALTLLNGSVYVSNTIISMPEAFNPAHWIYLGQQFDLFYVPTPFPEFKLDHGYARGTYVYYDNMVYRALNDVGVGYAHDNLLQQVNYANVPPSGYFPGTSSALSAWGTGVPFSVAPGTLYSSPANNYAPSYSQVFQEQYTATLASESTISLPGLIGKEIIQIIREIKPLLFSEYSWNKSTGILTMHNSALTEEQTLFILYSTVSASAVTSRWKKGDNRNPQMVATVIDIALYHVHSRIAPRNIPELRVKRYDDAIRWLKMCAKGDITADLPLIQPKSGSRIRWAGSIRNINSY